MRPATQLRLKHELEQFRNGCELGCANTSRLIGEAEKIGGDVIRQGGASYRTGKVNRVQFQAGGEPEKDTNKGVQA